MVNYIDFNDLARATGTRSDTAKVFVVAVLPFAIHEPVTP